MWGTSPEKLKKAQQELDAQIAVHDATGDINVASTTAPGISEEEKVDGDKGVETRVENKIKIKPKQKPKKKVEPVIGKPYFDIGLLQSEPKYRHEATNHFFVFDHTEVKKSHGSGKF